MRWPRLSWVADLPPEQPKMASHDVAVPGRTSHDNHEHVLDVVDCQASPRVPMQPASTVVLFGCTRCTFLQDVIIAGSWTLEQVTRLHRREDGALEDTGGQ